MNKEQSFGLRIKEIHMGMFDFTVYLAVGPRSKVQDYLRWKWKDKTIEIATEGQFGTFFHHETYGPVIWIPEKPKTPRQYATVAHEAAHAAFEILDWYGVPITKDTHEVFCHAVGYLVTKILERKSRANA